MSLIVAVVWMCGTGKSEVVSFLEETITCKKVYFGWIVLEEVKKRYGILTPEYERIVKEDMRALHWSAAIAHIALPILEQFFNENNTVLIDWVYSFSEYSLLKERFGESFVTLAVHAPKHLRYERLATRDHRPLNREQVDTRDYTEIMYIEKWWPIAIADWHIINNWTREELYEKINQVLEKLF